MITFKHEDEFPGETQLVELTTTGEHLATQVEAFKSFLRLIGHHPDNVERVVLRGREERQALVESGTQLELFPEDRS